MTGPNPIVAFIDPGATAAAAVTEAVETLSRPDRLGSHVSRAFIVAPCRVDVPLPPGWTVVNGLGAPEVCQWAFDAAAEADQALLIVNGNWHPTAESVGALIEALQLDPLFGVAVPRLATPDRQRAWTVPGWNQPATPVPVRVLAYEPEHRILAHADAPVMLVRRELTGSLSCSAGHWQGVSGMVADFTTRARRAGFRAVVANHVVVTAGPGGAAPPPLHDRDRRAMAVAYSELGQMTPGRVGPSIEAGERLLAAAFDAPDSLLLDARNLAALYNGTSAAILGMADALHRARPDRRVTLWVHADVAAWHALRDRYPAWALHLVGPPPAPHAAGVRLSQPWHASELETLAAAAAVNVYWMLDTIAWDIVYSAPDGLDLVWARMAAEADAVLFISAFSRDRFLTRFEPAPGVRTGVCHLSLSRADYLAEGGAAPPEGRYWLLVGNRYDHKHIGPTVDLLTRSFPRQRLVVFGDRRQVRTGLVTQLESGSIDEETVRGYYAGADLVVFPSFYEGFGLPMLQGLAHGRTIVLRASALVDELAGLYRGPGRLLTYTTDRELVELLNAWSRGEALQGVPLGADASAGQWTWDSAAARLLHLVDTLVAESPSNRMLARTGLSTRGLRNPLRQPAAAV